METHLGLMEAHPSAKEAHFEPIRLTLEPWRWIEKWKFAKFMNLHTNIGKGILAATSYIEVFLKILLST